MRVRTADAVMATVALIHIDDHWLISRTSVRSGPHATPLSPSPTTDEIHITRRGGGGANRHLHCINTSLTRPFI